MGRVPWRSGATNELSGPTSQPRARRRDTGHPGAKQWCPVPENARPGFQGPDLRGGGCGSNIFDGVAQPTIDTYADTTSPISARRLIASSVAPGTHVVVLTMSSTYNSLSTVTSCLFDYLQAAVLSDVQSPATTYPNVNCACDFDTAQTCAIAPARAF